MLAAIAPLAFVLLWSTGFIVARAVTPHASPELFLLVRMVLTACVLGIAASALRQRPPRGKRLMLHLVAGALMNGVYLCASWWAVAQGMPAGIMALLGALQPLVVAVIAFLLLSERLQGRGWAGLGIGLGGVILVLLPLLSTGQGITVSGLVVAVAALSILAMAAGTIIQGGSIAQESLFTAGALQNIGGASVALVATGLHGETMWDNSVTLWLGLAWSMAGLSIAAVSLLVWMTRHQGATRVSLLLLLIPPLTAIEAHFLFGENLTIIQILGFVLALGGVLLGRSGGAKHKSPA